MMRRIGWALFGAGLLAAAIFALQRGVGQAVLGLASEPETLLVPAQPVGPVPADRPFRLMLLGTSLTAWGDWPLELEQRLSACRPGGVVVERLARAGANSAWGSAALAQRLGAADHPPPDLLLAEFSINDSSLWRGMGLAQSRARHEEILAAADQAQVPVFLVTMSPAFGFKAWQRPAQTAYRALYVDLARDGGAGLIPTVPAWTALDPAAREEAMPDRLHPTDAAVIALSLPLMERALRPVLCPG